MEFIRIRNGNSIVLNYHYVHDEEVRARLTAQVNSIPTTLKIVGIAHARAGDFRSVDGLWSAILLFMNYDVGINFRTTAFRRTTGFSTEDEPR